MDLDLQTAFNLAVAAGGGLFGWALNTIWNAIKDVQSQDRVLADKVAAVEVLVAGSYVTRAEHMGAWADIKDSPKRIEDKLDGKADK